jgi:hypothetical protein
MSDGFLLDEVGGLQQLIVRESLPLKMMSYLFLVEPPVFLLACLKDFSMMRLGDSSS